MYMAPTFRYQLPQPTFQIPIIPKPPAPVHIVPPSLPFQKLSVNLPNHEYKIAKINTIPFDPRESKGARFDCLLEAVEFISKHCQVHHGFFTKQLCKKYLEFCRILDGPTGRYIVMKHFGKKEFDTAFNKVRQELETQKFAKSNAYRKDWIGKQFMKLFYVFFFIL